jgi:hypothetical protein
LGRVHELLINFEKASTSILFEKCRDILMLMVFNNSRPLPFFERIDKNVTKIDEMKDLLVKCGRKIRN